MILFPARVTRSVSFLLGSTLVMVALADWLFYGRNIGISVAIFTAVLSAVMVVRRFGMHRMTLAIKAGLALAMLIALAIEPSPIALALTAAAIIMLALVDSRAGSWFERLQVWVAFVVAGWVRVILDSQILARWKRKHPHSRLAMNFAVLPWLIPVGLSAIFVWLFWMANPIIEQWVNIFLTWLGDLLEEIPALLDAVRIFFWCVIAVVTWMLLRARAWRAKPHPRPKFVKPMTEAKVFSPQMVVRCLLMFNAVFAVQTVMDWTYLFGGFSLPKGMNHSEYAHRGAYPLMATAILAAAFVLMTFRPGKSTQSSRACRGLVYLWIGQNIQLLFSALWRLELYVSAWHLTRWRVAAAIWMGLVAMGFLWIIARIVFSRSNEWLITMNVVTTCVVLYACCLVDIDRFIATYNIEHCHEATGTGKTLGIEYIDHLGTDALPALVWLAEKSPAAVERYGLSSRIAILKEELESDLSDWRTWTFRRQNLARDSGLKTSEPPLLAQRPD